MLFVLSANARCWLSKHEMSTTTTAAAANQWKYEISSNRFSLNFHHAWSYGNRPLKEIAATAHHQNIYVCYELVFFFSNFVLFFFIIQVNVPLKRIRLWWISSIEAKKKSKKTRKRYNFNESHWNIGPYVLISRPDQIIARIMKFEICPK